jgi:hypothetical protein
MSRRHIAAGKRSVESLLSCARFARSRIMDLMTLDRVLAGEQELDAQDLLADVAQ